MRGRVRTLEAMAFFGMLAGFPLVKVHWLDQLPVLERFVDTGDRTGWYLFWALYVGSELALVVIAVGALRQTGSTRIDVGVRLHSLRPVAAGLGLAVVLGCVLSLRSVGSFEIAGTGTEYNVQGAATTGQRLVLLGVVTAAVFYEEFLYRGFAIARLEALGEP